MNNVKLSIITINYNNARGLRKTLASVASQTYRNIEHIIIDGASTDGSIDVIQEYEKSQISNLKSQISVSWVSETDTGIYNAINKGIEIALGKRIANTNHTSSYNSLNIHSLNESQCDYIQILNSGDILAAPDVTERMVNSLESLNAQRSTLNKQPAGILYGNMFKDKRDGSKLFRDTGNGNQRSTPLHPLETEWTMHDFMRKTINHDPTYIHRDLYEKYSLYDEKLRIVSDWKWFVNAVVFGGEKVFYTPIDVTIFDMTGISETNGDLLSEEHDRVLHEILPEAIIKDYYNYYLPIIQYKRLKKYHLWPLVYFIERVLFKLEKWHILR